MIRYDDLTLALTEDGSRIEIWSSSFGRGTSAPFVPPSLDSAIDTLLMATDLELRDFRRAALPADLAEDLGALGRVLFDSLFPEPIAKILLQCVTEAEASDGRIGVRIRLVLRWPPHLRHLQALPWELAGRQEIGGQFLVRQRFTTLVRTPGAVGHPVKRPPVEPPLKVLLLLSRPKDAPALALDAEQQRIAEAFARVAALFGVAPPTLQVVAAPLTVDAFRAVLRQGFHVVHFAGHGDFDADGAGSLDFENEDRSCRPFGGGALAEHLLLCPTLRLVVLNACWSALPGVSGDGEADLGVGTALAEAGVPAVVAMQRPIADAAAIELAGNLYAQLALGDPLELALCHCRIALAEKFPQSPAWAIPVLLLGADSGEIVVPPGRASDLSSPVARHVRNVSRLIHEKTRDFVGRQFLFERVEKQLEQHSCILLRAEPGFGKTAFLAEMVRRYRYIHHFNRLASADSNQKEHFLANVCSQLILRHQLPYPVLPVQAQRDSSLLLELCAEAAAKLDPGQKLILVVDALDEVDRQGEPLTRNPLDLPEVMPDRCALILTGRPDVKLQFEGNFWNPPELDSRSDENLADIERFIRLKLDRGRIPEFRRRLGIGEETLVERLRLRSEGNFMYLRYVLEDLEKGLFDSDTFETLPQGLENYYQHQWQRLQAQTGDVFYELAVPTLAALTFFRRPVSLDMIAAMIGRPGDRAKILPILAALRQFLRIEDREEGSRAKVYQLYHGSFHDFIRQRPEVEEQPIDESGLRFLQRKGKSEPGVAH